MHVYKTNTKKDYQYFKFMSAKFPLSFQHQLENKLNDVRFRGWLLAQFQIKSVVFFPGFIFYMPAVFSSLQIVI